MTPEDKVRLKHLYVEAIGRVGAIVNGLDPEGLLAIGAPPDEYETLISDLARLILHGEDAAEILRKRDGPPVMGSFTKAIEQLSELQRELLAR